MPVDDLVMPDTDTIQSFNATFECQTCSSRFVHKTSKVMLREYEAACVDTDCALARVEFLERELVKMARDIVDRDATIDAINERCALLNIELTSERRLRHEEAAERFLEDSQPYVVAAPDSEQQLRATARVDTPQEIAWM